MGRTHSEDGFTTFPFLFTAFFAFSPSFIAYSPIIALMDVWRRFAKNRRFSFSSLVSVKSKVSFFGAPDFGRGIVSPPFLIAVLIAVLYTVFINVSIGIFTHVFISV